MAFFSPGTMFFFFFSFLPVTPHVGLSLVSELSILLSGTLCPSAVELSRSMLLSQEHGSFPALLQLYYHTYPVIPTIGVPGL